MRKKSIRAIAAALVVAVLLPVAVAATWPVSNRYSWISQGYHTSHKAYDIASYSGTPIVPIRSGRVVFAGWKNNCGGYQVWVSHGNGIYSGYYHMSRVSAYKGEYVTASYTRLGRVGRSGCASGNHLHVEVWRGYPWASGSYRVNPWYYIDSGTWLPYRYR
jgi:murein DD-endopeptidase MepM/ murein hydrolase activator NlpD